jgi:ABC-type xylose transport system permease subunit
MPKNPKPPWKPSNPESLARQFSRLGWIGFWMQVVLIILPVILLVYILFISSPDSAQSKGIDLSNYLSYGSLLVMLFTIFWFYLYTRLAKRIPDPELRPPESTVMRTLWTGLGASCLGILFSMILMINAVLRILFILLATPQTGVPISATGGDPAKTLSAIDAVSLTSLLFTLTAELIVLAFSRWLLFRVTRPSAEITDATPGG